MENKEKNEDLEYKINALLNEISENGNLEWIKIKNIFRNILRLEEIRDKVVEIRDDYSKISGISLDELEVGKLRFLFEHMYQDFYNYLKDRGIELEESKTQYHTELLYKKNRSGIEGRYMRILNLLQHAYKTPLTTISIRLNLGKNEIENKLKDYNSKNFSLIEKDSWKWKIVVALDYYKQKFILGERLIDEKDKRLIDFFINYLEMMDIIEKIFKNNLSKERREEIITNMSTPITKMVLGIEEYKEIMKEIYKKSNNEIYKNSNIESFISNLLESLRTIFSYYGKYIKNDDYLSLKKSILESLAPLYAIATVPKNNEIGKEFEAKRRQLAKLIIERYNPTDEDKTIKNGEGENLWREIIVNRALDTNKKELYSLLGLSIKNIDDPLDEDYNKDYLFLKDDYF